MTQTSWDLVAPWYGKIVGEKGHYFHQNIIIPNSLKLLSLADNSLLLDLGCGQGILARLIPPSVEYTGIDISHSLITTARKLDTNRSHKFIVGDITKDLPLTRNYFTHATLILALQNIAEPEKVITNVAKHLTTKGVLLIVINHPYFRIPRASSWEIDEKNKIQYRRINRYLSPLKIPITTHPGKPNSPLTWSFHYPLSQYSKWLKDSGFTICMIEEWTSDKISTGKAARMENLARSQFPLFMALLAVRSAP